MTAAGVFHQIIADTLKRPPAQIRVLDFGCGSGDLVRDLLADGYDAYGCDIGADWPKDRGEWKRGLPATSWAREFRDRLSPIQSVPYRLPYDDSTFDAVVSVSVFEHVQNKEEAFAELARVLKPDGMGFHLIPSKWCLAEPHMFVPLASIMWPQVPDWWFRFWAFVGVRNQFQHGLGWREVAKLNEAYCRNGIHYWNPSKLRNEMKRIFGGYNDFARARVEKSERPMIRLLRAVGLLGPAVQLHSLLWIASVAHPNLLAHSRQNSVSLTKAESGI